MATRLLWHTGVASCYVSLEFSLACWQCRQQLTCRHVVTGATTGTWILTDFLLVKDPQLFCMLFSAFSLCYCDILEAKNSLCYQKSNVSQELLYIVLGHILLNSITCLRVRPGWGPRQTGQAQGFPLLHTASLAAFPRPGNKPPCPPTYPTYIHKHTPQMTSPSHPYISVISCLFSPTLLNSTPVSHPISTTFSPHPFSLLLSFILVLFPPQELRRTLIFYWY